MKISKKTIIFIISIVFFVVADRFLKFLCLKGYFNQPLSIISDIFSLNFAKNYYISFSIPLSGPILTTAIGLIILILLLYWLKLYIQNTKHQIVNTNLFPLTILIIGAMLNFTDRIRFGYVIDYFDLKYFTIFNLADIMILTGVIWLIIFNNHKKYG